MKPYDPRPSFRFHPYREEKLLNKELEEEVEEFLKILGELPPDYTQEIIDHSNSNFYKIIEAMNPSGV